MNLIKHWFNNAKRIVKDNPEFLFGIVFTGGILLPFLVELWNVKENDESDTDD